MKTGLGTTIERDLIATPCTASVTVFNPGYAGGESAPKTFTIGNIGLEITVEHSGHNLVMNWPEANIGFIMERAPVLCGTTWQAVAGSAATNLDVIPMDKNNEFFRHAYQLLSHMRQKLVRPDLFLRGIMGTNQVTSTYSARPLSRAVIRNPVALTGVLTMSSLPVRSAL